MPLVLLGIAIILLWIGGRGDNAGVARRSVGLLVGLVRWERRVRQRFRRSAISCRISSGDPSARHRTDDEVYRVDSSGSARRGHLSWRPVTLSYGSDCS